MPGPVANVVPSNAPLRTFIVNPSSQKAAAPASPPLAADQLTLSGRAAVETAKTPGLLQQAGDWLKGAWSAAKRKIGDLTTKIGHGAVTWFTGAQFKSFTTREVVWDPADVNNPRASETADAQKALPALRLKAAEALAKLTPPEQYQFEALKPFVKNQTMAEQALLTMLIDGRLTGSKDAWNQGSLLDQFHRLTTQPLAPGVDRALLLRDIIGEVETPERINQHGKGTCGATTAQILLVRRNPAEYVRLVAGLTSQAGKVQMAGGRTLTRQRDWDASNDGNRTTPSRMVQSALMYEGTLKILKYDNTADKSMLGPVPLWGGILGTGSARINTQITGIKYDSNVVWAWSRDRQWEGLKAGLAQNKGPIPVSLTWEGGGHFVQIDTVKDGMVFYTNPWGQTEKMSEAEFKQHVTTIEMPRR